MIGRGFGYFKEDSKIDLEKVKQSLSKIKKGRVIKNPLGRSEFHLSEVSVGNVSEIESEDGKKDKYLPFLFRASKIEKMQDASLNQSKTDIDVFSKNVGTPYFFFSYFFEDLIIFSRFSDVKHIFGTFLTNEIGVDVRTPGYDTERIYTDFDVKKEVGGAGFRNRLGLAQSGAIYYDTTKLGTSDIIVNEVKKASKYMTRLILDISGEIINANIYESGSIVLNQNWITIGNYYTQYKTLKGTLKPYEK